jgi:multidrug efflux pump subunit AcrA (membrane-fusion protein)
MDNVKMNVFDGMEVKIKLPRDRKVEALVVPRDAVIVKFGQNVVFVNNDGKAMMLPVQIINFLGNEVAIGAQGLMPGMDVVSKGNERIFPNMPIKPINKK